MKKLFWNQIKCVHFGLQLWVWQVCSRVITTTTKILNSFISFLVNLPSPATVLGNRSSVLQPSHFGFPKMSYKWSHTVGSLWSLIYFTQQNAFEIHPCYCLNTHIFCPFYWSLVSHCMDVVLHQLKDVGVDSNFWKLWISCYKYVLTGVNIKSHFSWVNFEEWDGWVICLTL